MKECEKIYNYINKNKDKDTVIGIPEWLKGYDCNHFLRVLWSILVIGYGDYGVSPRYGWLDSENVDLFLKDFYEALEELLGE